MILAILFGARTATGFQFQSIGAATAQCAFLLVAEPPLQQERTAVSQARLSGLVLMPVVIAGIAWGAMNLACVLFFSYAPLLMVAQGSSPAVAASLTSLAIWFTILAIPSGGYLVHRSGRPIAAIVACSLIAGRGRDTGLGAVT